MPSKLLLIAVLLFIPIFQPLGCPPMEELKGGTSGAKNFKINNSTQEYVLRLFNSGKSLDEITAARHAGDLGIGPRIHYIAPAYEAMLMDFVEGQTLSPSMLGQGENLRTLAQMIRRLHDSTGQFPRGLTPFEKIGQALGELKESGTPFPTAEIDAALKKLQKMRPQFHAQPLVPCHFDLNALNIIGKEGEFKFIDWTDAAMGYAYCDLGYFVLLNNLGEEQSRPLLFHYLGRNPSAKEYKLFQLGKKICMLRLFISTLPAYKSLLAQKGLDHVELKRMVWDPKQPPLEHFITLHQTGRLTSPELLMEASLCALRTFLTTRESNE